MTRLSLIGRMAALVLLALVTAAGVGGAGSGEALAAETTGEQTRGASTFPGPITGDDSGILRERGYVEGITNLPQPLAGVLQQPQGRDWRRLHNQEVTFWGAWIILGFSLILALFLAVRGRVELVRGFDGRTVERFNALERGNHWMVALSFIVVALTGIVLLWGQYLIKPLIGAGPYAPVAQWSALLHMAAMVPWVLGVLLMAILWVRRNLPSALDWEWLKRGGGFLRRGDHAPAAKFNAGQKMIFWAVVLGAVVLLPTGLSLMFPFFWWGYTGMQVVQIVHAAVGVLLIAVIIGHIYIGTVGMQGAFDAMWSGRVDLNWAREHHDHWVAELEHQARPNEPPYRDRGYTQPAE